MTAPRAQLPRRTRSALGIGILCALFALALAPTRVSAQDVSDVFGDLGTQRVAGEQEELAPEAMREGEGALAGNVYDGESGAPVKGASVILIWPAPADGSSARQEVELTEFDGGYVFASVPPGQYTLTFVKSGYRTSTMTDFTVAAGEVNRADFPLSPVAASDGGAVLQLDAFVVEADQVGDMMTAMELRLESDSMLNVMSAEDFSKFASSDVADALTRVAGVNVVDSKFAVIRGLDDRYSSTMFNGAPVPSPDPERQSVQLDLFPSKVVGDLTVEKTFLPRLPGNSAAGAIDVLTTNYPDQFEIKLDVATRINDNAIDSFLRYEPNNPVGVPESGLDAVGGEVGISVGGRSEIGRREVRYKAVGAWKSDFATRFGFQEGREPLLGRNSNLPFLQATGDLALGELSLTQGLFDLEQSTLETQWLVFGGAGIDLDRDGDHTLDLNVFYIDKNEETVESKTNGYVPAFDYSTLVPGGALYNGELGPFVTLTSWLNNEEREDGDNQEQSRGPLWFSNFNESTAIATQRDLLITQVNGAHELDSVEGLTIGWAANFARTTQQDEARGTNYWYEPCGWSISLACSGGTPRIPVPTVYPVTAEALGEGAYFASGASGGFVYSDLDVDEKQGFGRLDLEYERDLGRRLVGTVTTGGWFEYAIREVDSEFLAQGPGRQAIPLPPEVTRDAPALGRAVFGPNGVPRMPTGELVNLAEADIEQTREVWAGYLGGKLTAFEDWDFLAGLRLESIGLGTQGAPFRGPEFLESDGSRQIFPSKYLYLDRPDNPGSGADPGDGFGATPPAGFLFADQIVGVPVQPDFSKTQCDPAPPAAPRGCVDLRSDAEIRDALSNDFSELNVLPSAGITYRAFDWWTIRAAYSETVVRPSFRELGYYASVQAGNDEVIVGNPYLDLSTVQSVDGRFEFNFGELNDLVAISGFWKDIDQPIESILLASPVGRPAVARTFFNNDNPASLWGLEVEFQKALDFLGWDFLEYFSIGGNGTYIDARVARSQVEIDRYSDFFAINQRDRSRQRYTQLAPERRLFGQPEWIVNANVTFDHPDWGTRATIAYYQISDILDAAGSVRTADGGQAVSGSIDRYVAGFDRLDLIFSQELWAGFSMKFRVKNVTDSLRGRYYDPNQTTARIWERQFRVGRSYKLTLTYLFSM